APSPGPQLAPPAFLADSSDPPQPPRTALVLLCSRVHLPPSKADIVCPKRSYAAGLHSARFPALSRIVLAVYFPTQMSPSSVYATTSRDWPNLAGDAVGVVVRQQPNFAQHGADAVLLHVVAPVLVA